MRIFIRLKKLGDKISPTNACIPENRYRFKLWFSMSGFTLKSKPQDRIQRIFRRYSRNTSHSELQNPLHNG